MCIGLSLATVVRANFIVQILFNNGNPYQCSSSEWSQLEYLIYVMSQNQRNLRGADEKGAEAFTEYAEEEGEEGKQRELWPNYCANRCSGFTPRRCMALNCVGYRRRGLEMTRNLFWSTDCNNQISELNNLITNFRNNGLSAGCRQFLEQQRQYNCFTNSNC